MNKYAVIVSASNQQNLREVSESCVAALRSISPSVLVILPNIFLFPSEKDLTGAFALLPKSPHLDVQVLLFEIRGGYRADTRLSQASDLSQFFQL